MTLIEALLALIRSAPADYAAIKALYDQVRNVLPINDQGTVDDALAAIAPQLDADVAQLDADSKVIEAQAAGSAEIGSETKGPAQETVEHAPDKGTVVQPPAPEADAPGALPAATQGPDHPTAEDLKNEALEKSPAVIEDAAT